MHKFVIELITEARYVVLAKFAVETSKVEEYFKAYAFIPGVRITMSDVTAEEAASLEVR